MSPEQLFSLVRAGTYLIPICLTVAVMLLPYPRGIALRSIPAVLVAWVASVLYTTMVYNPAGIARGHTLGHHFPEASYDNNTVVVSLLAGWVVPAVTVLVFVVLRKRLLRGIHLAPN